MKTAQSEHFSFATSCQCRVDADGDFDLVLPNGKHISGEGGRQAAEAEHTRWLLKQAERGTTKAGAGGGWFCIPLR